MARGTSPTPPSKRGVQESQMRETDSRGSGNYSRSCRKEDDARNRLCGRLPGEKIIQPLKGERFFGLPVLIVIGEKTVGKKPGANELKEF